MAEAVRSYRALEALAPCPEELQFEVGCALEATGQSQEAFALYREFAARCPDDPEAETALVRAAELARTRLGDAAKARDCYQALLRTYPHSPWVGRCRERLRELTR